MHAGQRQRRAVGSSRRHRSRIVVWADKTRPVEATRAIVHNRDRRRKEGLMKLRWFVALGLVGLVLYAAYDLYWPRHEDLRRFDADAVGSLQAGTWRSD